MMKGTIRVATGRDFGAELDSRLCEGELMFLVGAGVSMIAPTGLPSGAELLSRTLDQCVSEAMARHYLSLATSTDRWSKIVPELVFQRVHDAIGALPSEPYQSMFRAEANRLHARLATEMDLGRASVSTTNFDRLISSQSRQQREPLHLHGHIDDLTQMTATIRQVGRGLPDQLEKRFVDQIRRSRALVVLGYSGNDADIMSAVQAASPRQVIWVVRSKDDRAVENLNSYRDIHAEVVQVELDELGFAWGTEPVVSKVPSSTGSTAAMTPSLGQQYEIVVGCLQLIDKYELSLKAAEHVLDVHGASVETGAALALASQALNKLDRQVEARQMAAEGLRVATKDDNLRCRLLLQRGIAVVDDRPNELGAAIRDFEEAAQLAMKLSKDGSPDDRSLLGMALHNLGYAQTVLYLEEGEPLALSRAAEYYKRAITVKRQSGDIRYLATSYRNLAAVLLVSGSKANAIEPRAEFLSLADKYSLSWDRAYFDALCAQLFQRAGLPLQAVASAQLAIDQFDTMPDQTSMVAQMRDVISLQGKRDSSQQ